MKNRCDILLVGQIPPPFHGQAVATGMLFDHDWPGFQVEKLRMAFSDDMESVGEASWTKAWRLICLVLSTWKVVLRCRPRVLYYLPASPNLTPVIRDVIYLALVRWIFKKTVFHYHAGGLDDFFRSRKWLSRFTQMVYNDADCSVDVNITVPPSGAYFNAKRNEVVMNGLDVGDAKRGRTMDAKFQVLYLGLLCEPKGVMTLIDTAKILRASDCHCEFMLVGGWESAEFRDEFQARVDDAGVSDVFNYGGVKRGDDKWQAYADADVFIFPSHHPTETFGLVLIEAMAFGLPIVTNRWRGIPHVIGDSGCAKMCEVQNADEYARFIKELMGNSETRIAMGEAARRRYENNFTRRHFVEGMEEIFSTVLKD